LNLLLLLSALLSALTGVAGGAQRLDAAPAVARSIGRSAIQAVAPAATSRPPATRPVLIEVVAPLVRFTQAVIAPAIPLWASRRRE
jgi:hypothetical protein